MNKKRITILAALATAGMIASGNAQAVPWCHGGTIVTVADVQWSHADLLNETQGMTVPINVINADQYLASQAGNNYCQTYAGGGGPGSVPGNGTVMFDAYAPYTFTNTYYYQLQDGLEFECNKCYAVPPLDPEPELPRLP